MAQFTDDDSILHDLTELERGNTGTPAKAVARIALDLASHTKALLGTGTLADKRLEPDRDTALESLSHAVEAIKRIISKA
jgi:hypothetical protein